MPLQYSYLNDGKLRQPSQTKQLPRYPHRDIPNYTVHSRAHDLCTAWASKQAYYVRAPGRPFRHRFPDFVERWTQLLGCNTSQDGYLQWQLWRVWDVGFILSFAGTRRGMSRECFEDLRTCFDTQATFFHGFQVHKGALERLRSLLPGLSSRICTAMDRSLKQYPQDKTLLSPAYHTASSRGLQAPLYCTGHSLGGQLAVLTSIDLLDTAQHLSCSAGGCWTYGAPLVVLNQDPDARVAAMQHTAQHSWRQMEFIHFVNLHDKFAGWLGSRSYIKGLREYRPLGNFCILKRPEGVWKGTLVAGRQVEAVMAAQSNDVCLWKTWPNVRDDHDIETYMAALQACSVRVL